MTLEKMCVIRVIGDIIFNTAFFVTLQLFMKCVGNSIGTVAVTN